MIISSLCIIMISLCSHFVNLILNVLTVFLIIFLVLSSNCTIDLCVMNIGGNIQNVRPQDLYPADARFFSLFFYYLAVKLTVFPRRFYHRKDKSSLFYQSALLEQKLNICALNFLKHKLECFLFGK